VTKFSPTLKQLQAHLHEHSLQMASLRAALDVQVTRIAQMQAELDVLPQARKRRQLLRALLTKQSMDHATRV
jgi:multidrug resistance efflux pump